MSPPVLRLLEGRLHVRPRREHAAAEGFPFPDSDDLRPDRVSARLRSNPGLDALNEGEEAEELDRRTVGHGASSDYRGPARWRQPKGTLDQILG